MEVPSSREVDTGPDQMHDGVACSYAHCKQHREDYHEDHHEAVLHVVIHPQVGLAGSPQGPVQVLESEHHVVKSAESWAEVILLLIQVAPNGELVVFVPLEHPRLQRASQRRLLTLLPLTSVQNRFRDFL